MTKSDEVFNVGSKPRVPKMLKKIPTLMSLKNKKNKKNKIQSILEVSFEVPLALEFPGLNLNIRFGLLQLRTGIL
jgi:hypothetical protein